MKDINDLIRTKRVQNWLSAFDDNSNRNKAIWLLNRLILISEKDFEAGIKKSFENILTKTTKKIAIIIVNDYPKQNGHSPDILLQKIKKIFPSGNNNRIVPITTLELKNKTELLKKLNECGIVVLANDFIGTGHQISHFWHGTGKTTMEGKPYSIPVEIRKSIVSKISRKHLRLMIFSFIIYEAGMKFLIKNSLKKEIKPIPFINKSDFISYVKPIISKGYPMPLKNFVESQKYSSGYKNSAAFAVFYYRAPNNLPSIFYNTKNPLFCKSRKIPKEILPFFGNIQEDYNDVNFLSQSWNPSLLYALKWQQTKSAQKNIIIALALLSKNISLEKIKSLYTNYEQILNFLKENYLIDENNKITPWGADFFIRYKKKKKLEFEYGFGEDYIPKSFRRIPRF